MKIDSLGYQTDLIFLRFDGIIEDRSDHLLIRTPTSPTYFWGNFLLFDQCPKEGDFVRWRALFVEEIGEPEEVGHLVLAWDSAAGEKGVIAPFLEAGMSLVESVVLVAKEVNPPPRYNDEVEIRPLAYDDDMAWSELLALQMRCRPDHFTVEGYQLFREQQIERTRKMIHAGLGYWFGGFLDGKLAGSLGIFSENGVARYQDVETDPDFRRRGVCGTLVYEAAKYLMERREIERLVMVADEHYHAARIYESVGFVAAEKQVGVEWWVGKKD